MPNGFWYASGPKRMDERIPGSAFSKGDILTLNSSSSFSRLNPYATETATVYAIACADSIDSINDKVPAVVVQPTTYFWGAVTAGSALTTGENSGVSFDTGLTGRYEVDASTTTLRVVVVEGTDRIDQSVQSKAIVQFKSAAGELGLS
jgi:hypothetical protein